jgi:hypothetical protein
VPLNLGETSITLEFILERKFKVDLQCLAPLRIDLVKAGVIGTTLVEQLSNYFSDHRNHLPPKHQGTFVIPIQQIASKKYEDLLPLRTMTVKKCGILSLSFQRIDHLQQPIVTGIFSNIALRIKSN